MDYKTIITELDKFGITGKLEQSHFLAQADHESQGFTKFSEGSKFTFARAKVIWGARKEVIDAKRVELGVIDKDFCPQPWLFNTVYGSRMGNEKNGTNDNDGFDYRGGGIFQLTGTDNHLGFLNWLHRQGKYLNLTLQTVDEFVKTQDGAVISAIWFWLDKKIGIDARRDDNKAVTRKINGGFIDEDKRLILVNKYKKLLGA